MMTRLLCVAALLCTVACSKKDEQSKEQPAKKPDAAAAKPVKAIDAAPVVAKAADAAPVAANPIDAAPSQNGEPPKTDDDTPKNLKVLSKKWSRDRVEREMRTYTKALGVKCKYCHVGKDYASDKNEKKAISRKMITMTNSMNRKYFKGSKNKLTCWTCHKGKAVLE